MSASVQLSDIPIFRPDGQSIQDTVNKAKAAADQIPSVLKRAGVVGVASLFGVPVLAVTAVKWVVWNPAERLYKGSVTSSAPLELYRDSVVKNYLANDAEVKAEKYALQLLNTKCVTQEAVEAFKGLAAYCKKIDFSKAEIGFDSFDEFLSAKEHQYIFTTILGEEGKQALSELIQKGELPISVPQIHSFLDQYFPYFYWIDSPVPATMLGVDSSCLTAGNQEVDIQGWNADFIKSVSSWTYDDTVQGRKAYLLKYFATYPEHLEKLTLRKDQTILISKQQLVNLIECIGKSPVCREFCLPSSESSWSDFTKLLNKHGFKESDEDIDYVIFKR